MIAADDLLDRTVGELVVSRVGGLVVLWVPRGGAGFIGRRVACARRLR
jgi:hypothetical protein